jgi:hypothetical protein
MGYRRGEPISKEVIVVRLERTADRYARTEPDIPGRVRAQAAGSRDRRGGKPGPTDTEEEEFARHADREVANDPPDSVQPDETDEKEFFRHTRRRVANDPPDSIQHEKEDEMRRNLEFEDLDEMEARDLADLDALDDPEADEDIDDLLYDEEDEGDGLLYRRLL